MNTYLYRLHFKAPLHFGKAGIGLESTEERLSSESLTSALMNALALLGEVESALEAVQRETPAFVLSSLFPFGPSQHGSEIVYAMPKPHSAPEVENESVLSKWGKDLKRLRYLVPDHFFKWIGHVPLTSKDVKEVINLNRSLALPWDRTPGKGWWATELRPRVALDRSSQNSNIWFCGAICFQSKAGLYGLVRIDDDSWKPKLEAAFRFLGDLGLGGERTYGMGTFEFSGFQSADPVLLPQSYQNIRRHVLLSLYYPSEQERQHISDIFETWDFVESRGYIVSGRMTTTLKRKRVRMIREGSVAREPVKGTVVDVTPENFQSLGLTHRVFRSGLAFLVP